jgi:hypothetical protein
LCSGRGGFLLGSKFIINVYAYYASAAISTTMEITSAAILLLFFFGS